MQRKAISNSTRESWAHNSREPLLSLGHEGARIRSCSWSPKRVVVDRGSFENRLLSIKEITGALEALKGGSQGEKTTLISFSFHSAPAGASHRLDSFEARRQGSLSTWSVGYRVQKDISDVKGHGSSPEQGIWLIKASYPKSGDLGR